MTKPKNIHRPTLLHTNVPEDVRAKLDLYLLSDVENRVPHGAYGKFLAARIREFFDDAHLDLSPWLDPSGPPMMVRGSARTIDALQGALDRLGLSPKETSQCS